MQDEPNINKKLSYSINNKHQHEDICKLGKAFSSMERVRIMYAIQQKPMYLVELADLLNIPISSVSRHIDILADAQLLYISFTPGPKGHSKLCSKAILNASVELEDMQSNFVNLSDWSTEMPIGLYVDSNITAPCGMVGTTEELNDFDDPSVFYSAKRAVAELLWFNSGYITYKLPNKKFDRRCDELIFSFEICSETIYYRDKWPSDITIEVNNVEIDTFTSPGDFGGRRGKYTPEFWPLISTQFGILMVFTINQIGVFVNNVLTNKSITIDKLKLENCDFVQLKLWIKDDAVHKGGLNLFGKHFGDYPQHIIMTKKYFNQP